MLNQPTLEKLEILRLHGMAEAFRAQSDPAQRDGLAALAFEERFALLVDQEWSWRQNRALARRLTQAKFRYHDASVEDIDFRAPRGLDRSCARSRRTPPGSESIRISSYWARAGSAKAGWPAPWPKKRAGTASAPSSFVSLSYFASWLWPAPTAAWEAGWLGWPAWTC